MGTTLTRMVGLARSARVRAALEKYQDPFVAVHDGYFSTVGCVHYPRPAGPGQMPYPPGGMGVHFVNPALIQDPAINPDQPEALVYAPDRDGTLQAIAECLAGVRTFRRWHGLPRAAIGC